MNSEKTHSKAHQRCLKLVEDACSNCKYLTLTVTLYPQNYLLSAKAKQAKKAWILIFRCFCKIYAKTAKEKGMVSKLFFKQVLMI